MALPYPQEAAAVDPRWSSSHLGVGFNSQIGLNTNIGIDTYGSGFNSYSNYDAYNQYNGYSSKLITDCM